MSIEPEGFDGSLTSFTNQIGFDYAALDLVVDGGSRTSAREGFSYYSGFPAETRPSRVPTGERRRFVILNGQPGPSQWEILHISSNYSSSQAAAIRTIIDEVAPSTGGGDPMVSIGVVASPLGSATITGGGVYSPGDEVTLSFTLNPGYRFVQWQGGVDDSIVEEATLTAETDMTITALFAKQWNLAIETEEGGSVEGGGSHDDGATVTITAIPDEGYRFDRWETISEDEEEDFAVADPTSLSTTLVLNEDQTVAARFVKVWTLGVNANAGGNVTGAGTFDDGAVVPISVSVFEGYRFTGWLGAGVADPSALETTFTVSATTTVTATFVEVFELVVNASVGGDAEGSGMFDAGTMAEVVALPEAGYRFAGWEGEGLADATARETMVVVSGDALVTARFLKVWTLGVEASVGGSGSGSGTFDEGTVVPIMATAEDGYRFDQWIGDGVADVGLPQTSVVVSSNAEVMATFVKVWALTVDASAGGAVEGSGTFDTGQTVPITASVSEGYRFGGWEGDGVADASALETTITLSANTTATATFVKLWTLEIAGGAGGTVEGAGTFDEDAIVPIRAMANEDFQFVRWEGSDAIADFMAAETSVTIASALALTAIFEMKEPETPPDQDGDGLPDVWEMENGLDSEDPSDAAEDADSDSYTNAQEYLALTDPQDPISRLTIVSVENEAAGLSIRWSSQLGVRYQLEATGDLATGWTNVSAVVTAEAILSEINGIDPNMGRYYRVRILPAIEN